jgi:hypothetical protein
MEPVTEPRSSTGSGLVGGEAGFSLVEVLIAAVLLVVVVLGLIPLFALSLSQNLAGREYSVASQHGRSQVEEVVPLPLDHPRLAVPDGQPESVLDEVLDPATGRFTSAAVSAPVAWSRATTVRQYNVGDLYEAGRLVTPLDGGSPPNHVHLREVIVEVESEREAGGGGLGGGREVVLSTVRGF